MVFQLVVLLLSFGIQRMIMTKLVLGIEKIDLIRAGNAAVELVHMKGPDQLMEKLHAEKIFWFTILLFLQTQQIPKLFYRFHTNNPLVNYLKYSD